MGWRGEGAEGKGLSSREPLPSGVKGMGQIGQWRRSGRDQHLPLPALLTPTPTLPHSPKLGMDPQVSCGPKAAEKWTVLLGCQISKVAPGGLEGLQPAPGCRVSPVDPALRLVGGLGKPGVAPSSRLQREQLRGSCRLSRRHRLHI